MFPEIIYNILTFVTSVIDGIEPYGLVNSEWKEICDYILRNKLVFTKSTLSQLYTIHESPMIGGREYAYMFQCSAQQPQTIVAYNCPTNNTIRVDWWKALVIQELQWKKLVLVGVSVTDLANIIRKLPKSRVGTIVYVAAAAEFTQELQSLLFEHKCLTIEHYSPNGTSHVVTQTRIDESIVVGDMISGVHILIDLMEKYSIPLFNCTLGGTRKNTFIQQLIQSVENNDSQLFALLDYLIERWSSTEQVRKIHQLLLHLTNSVKSMKVCDDYSFIITNNSE
jgi:hypothetical protein